MATNQRIYVTVEHDEKGNPKPGSERLVKAGSQAQAVGHVVRSRYSAKVANQDDLVRLMGEGQKVEEASGE